MSRILIAGGPRTGKTTYADRIGASAGLVARHTDDLVGRLDWSECSAEVARWMAEDGPWLIEGVAVPRAIRKWLAAHPGDAAPADVIVWMPVPIVPRTPGQDAMAKGVETVWREVLPELRRRKAPILESRDARECATRAHLALTFDASANIV